MLYGRILGPYIAALAALTLIVLCLVTGYSQTNIGGVTIAQDQEPLMETEVTAILILAFVWRIAR